MYLTWLDSNSWLIEIGGQRILLDPWLVGDLTFGNTPWIFRGHRTQDRSIPEHLDLILLSQGLEDHAHPPTLRALDRTIPVVGSPGAAKVAETLGFTQVTALAHGDSFTLNDAVTIEATLGSPIGPTTRENGYLLKQLADGITLYYEPHGYHPPALRQYGSFDVVVTPVIDLRLPLLGPVIQGSQSALQLAQWVKPQVMLPTAAGGDIEFEGLLVKFLKAVGSPAELQTQLTQAGLTTRVLEPKPGERVAVPLQSPLPQADAVATPG
jgi:L-ascorbate metabolism protein UlaG (beta-lactamase superfamily)